MQLLDCGELQTLFSSMYRTHNRYRNPIRFPCVKWSIIIFLSFFFVILLMIYILINKVGTMKSWQGRLIRKTKYEVINVDVPNYLLVDVSSGKQPTCAQMFTKVVPNLQQTNVTDKELIETIVGSSIRGNLNPAYLSVNIEDKSSFFTKSKFCSNKTYEKILFFSSENEENLADDPIWIESTLKNMTNGLQCTDFNLNKCEVLSPDKEQLKLFELDRQTIIKRKKWKQDRYASTLVDHLYVFLRRNARDYNFGDKTWTKNVFHAFNITFEKNWVYENEISMSIHVSYQKPAAHNFICRAYLRAKTDTKIMPFTDQILVTFDQLEPSTLYKICADCAKIDPVCVDVETTSESWSSFRKIPAKNKRLHTGHILILSIVLVIFVLILTFFKLTCVIRRCFVEACVKLNAFGTGIWTSSCSFFNRQRQTSHPKRSPRESITSLNSSTMEGESVCDSRSEISSINSTICRNSLNY